MNDDELERHLKFIETGMVFLFGYLLVLMSMVVGYGGGSGLLVALTLVLAFCAISMGLAMLSTGYNRRLWNRVGINIPFSGESA